MITARYRIWILSLTLAIGSFFSVSYANTASTELGIPTVTRSGSQLIITWPAYTGDKSFEGYAIQWSDNSLRLKMNEYARQYLGKSTSISIRGADFQRREDYYFRIYGWKTNESTSKKELIFGSKIRKWRENADFTFTNEEVVPNDPIIVTSTSSSSSTTTDTTLYDFPNLSARAFDTFVRFSWSKPNLASNEYDGTKIELSDKSDFSNIILTLEASEGDSKGEMEGLLPETTYYARGSYHKNGSPLGSYATKTFNTLKAIARDGRSRASRNIKKLEKRSWGRSISLGATSTTTTSTSSTSSSTSTTTTASSFDSSTTDTNAIADRIAELESLIRKYQSEIRSLRSKVSGTSTRRTTTSRSSTTRRTSTKRKIDRSAIRARLMRRRNAQ